MKNDVKQVDREVYLAFNNLTPEHALEVREGYWDGTTGMQILAAHRIAAEAAKDAEYADKMAALQARVAELESFARAVLMLESIPLAARTEILSAAQCIGLATEIADVDTHIASLKEPTQ